MTRAEAGTRHPHDLTDPEAQRLRARYLRWRVEMFETTP